MCVLTVSETENFVFFLLFKYNENLKKKRKQEYKSERSLSANIPQKIKMVVLNQNLEL